MYVDKAKIVINASEEKLGWVIGEFEKMKVDIAAIPILLNSDQFQSDISAFLGMLVLMKDGKTTIKTVWQCRACLFTGR